MNHSFIQKIQNSYSMVILRDSKLLACFFVAVLAIRTDQYGCRISHKYNFKLCLQSGFFSTPPPPFPHPPQDSSSYLRASHPVIATSSQNNIVFPSSFFNLIHNFNASTLTYFFFFRLFDFEEGAAPVGVAMCTREPTPYDHPTNPNIKFWDLPGLGTPNHPDMETYYEKLQLEKYHTYLIFTAARFDLELAKKIRSTGKKVFFIRTKIDNSVRAESRKRPFDEEALLTKIRRNCLESLGDLLTDEQDIFLISNHQPEKWEFVRLTMAILDAVTGYHKESKRPPGRLANSIIGHLPREISRPASFFFFFSFLKEGLLSPKS